MTPPRAPPPGGGCCYSLPESLGEGEEAAASAICRREVGCRAEPAPSPPPLPPGQRRGRGIMFVFPR